MLLLLLQTSIHEVSPPATVLLISSIFLITDSFGFSQPLDITAINNTPIAFASVLEASNVPEGLAAICSLGIFIVVVLNSLRGFYSGLWL